MLYIDLNLVLALSNYVDLLPSHMYRRYIVSRLVILSCARMLINRAESVFSSMTGQDYVEFSAIWGPLCNIDEGCKVNIFIIFCKTYFGNSQKWFKGLFKKSKYHKNSSEMNELELDLIRDKFLSKSVENLKSYIFPLEPQKKCIFCGLSYCWAMEL